MPNISKRVKNINTLVDRTKAYELKQALDLVKKTATAKFDESVDVAVNLGIDAKKSDQVVRGSVVLPRGTGKVVRVAVFTQGANAEKAKAAGADIVGFDDLAEKIKGGFMDFDVVIATPDAMKVVGPLGQVLGPRGLMPNRGAHRRDQQGEARLHQGDLPEEGIGLEHDGRGHPHRSIELRRRTGAGRSLKTLGRRRASRRRRVIKDRRRSTGAQTREAAIPKPTQIAHPRTGFPQVDRGAPGREVAMNAKETGP